MAGSKKENGFISAIDLIKKAHGNDSIAKLSDRPQEYEGISSGSIGLDIALGGNGFPKGRIIEVFGPEASGKTTVALNAIASAQQLGMNAAVIDAEHAMDPSWAKKNGVDIDNLYIAQPTFGEEGLQIAEKLIKSNDCGIVVIDSVAALTPKAELEGQIGDSHVGLQARMMSQAMRLFTSAISRSSTVVIFINQIREKINTGGGYGPTTSQPGGRALKFYSSQRLDIRRIGQVKASDDTVIGAKIKANVVKNKMAPPFAVAEFQIMGEYGLSTDHEILEIGLKKKVISQSGSWYSLGDIRLGQGKEKSVDLIRENKQIKSNILEAILVDQNPPE